MYVIKGGVGETPTAWPSTAVTVTGIIPLLLAAAAAAGLVYLFVRPK